MTLLAEVIIRDTRANQPAANTVAGGTVYYVTDEFVTERSNGSAWQDISDGGAGGGSSVWTQIVAPTSFPSANFVDITSIPSTYSELWLVIIGASCDTATRFIQVLWSSDNGSSFPDGSFWGTTINHTTVSSTVNAVSMITATAQAAAVACTHHLRIVGGNSASLPLYVQGSGTIIDGSNGWSTQVSTTAVTAVLNALRIRWNSTGNFDSGTYALYGK